MLKLNKITKIYTLGDLKQKALKEVSLDFPDSGFVSILGPSGSGKTTLLNIIGGLDHYTSGDLIIDGVSTKNYKSSDWDAYRNHRIGFVFQSYNLISHQTILSNVRLALTLSGISKREGKRRAKKALESVGLGDHINKRPAQLSGGQMQRVAIARALVNDPDIILADEPTGALDSETSVQIMELLRVIAREKLIIMVTHNPDLAKKYSTRIINLKDGVITKDETNNSKQHKLSEKTPENPELNPEKFTKARKKDKKTKMSFLTALSLSFNNLLTKKGRTVLVAFAGSIGIIGIALILAISTGFQRYIDSIQEDTLSSYPLTIMEESFSLENLLAPIDEDALEESADNNDSSDSEVREYPLLANTLKSVSTNDTKSFKSHLEKNRESLKNDLSSVSYGYSVEPNIYTIDKTNSVVKLNPSDLFSSMFGENSMMGSFSTFSSIYSQINTDQETLNSQYDVLAGRWPEKYDELVINLSTKGVISDYLAYELGLKDTKELTTLVTKLLSGESVEINNESLELSYEDLLNLDLRLILPADLYSYNEKYSAYEEMSGDKAYLENVYNNKSIKLKVVGIVSRKEGTTTASLNEGVNFRPELIEYIINSSKNTEIVKKQLDNPEIDVFSNNRFDQEENRFDYGFSDLVSVDNEKLAQTFNITIDESALSSAIETRMTEIAESINIDTTPAESELKSTLETFLEQFYSSLPETFKKSDSDVFVEKYLNEFEPGEKLSSLEQTYKMPKEALKTVFSGILKSFYEPYVAAYSTIDPSLTEDPEDPVAKKNDMLYSAIKEGIISSPELSATIKELAKTMTEIKIKAEVLTEVGDLVAYVSSTFAKSFNIDPSAITSAFTLNFSEDELMRVMQSMMNNTKTTQKTNLISLGYQDLDAPTYIALYFESFEGKDNFLAFIKNYNDSVEKDKQINYSDATGILMSSVKVIVDAVSYVLIAFVSISLIVSSIMIGVITYISVYERTKEIGILRAIGASKHNISSIFNAETFIIGLLSGLFGIGISYALIPVINSVIHSFTGNIPLNASLAVSSAIILIVLSVILTLIGGLIPAKTASRKDPVEALRSE
ncbi:ABC transporter ATP-binding protein/permease [Candidatus Saccharibacteria bacterium]|nr:ABC transporter ATP-binding protein/permease [Candidatus Saccharibacteria bacterium]